MTDQNGSKPQHTEQPSTEDPNRNHWIEKVEADPGHADNYAERWKRLAAEGKDLDGEARMIDAMAERGARILDAGCGTGRVGGRLAQLGHTVVGVDLDATLIEHARADFADTDATWLVGNLAELDLPAADISDGFDLIVCAGNVMSFLAVPERREALRRMGFHLRGNGRLVIGFGSGRGYDFQDFLDDMAHAGLSIEVGLSTWDLRPFDSDSDFLITISSRAKTPNP